MVKKFLEVGKIVSTHGIKGEFKVQPWCNSADFFDGLESLYLKKGDSKLEILSVRSHKNIVILKVNDIDAIEKAEQLIGEILYVNRDDVELSEGEYFIQDIIGLEVFDKTTNLYYGKVTDVLKTGANDVYQITDDNGKNYLIPVIDDVICDINIGENKMTIHPLEGIFG